MIKQPSFHEGELAIQQRVGVSEIAHRHARGYRPDIPASLHDWVHQQVMLVCGSEDDEGHIWASIVMGLPGFIKMLDEHQFALLDECYAPVNADPLWENLSHSPRLGGLLIDFVRRLRLRVNGFAKQTATLGWSVGVDRAYGNCPKYIQSRRWQLPQAAKPIASVPSRKGDRLSTAHTRWIRHADTFFIATSHQEQGLDVSHRGGPRGFVEVLNDQRLRVPDYLGNSMFNTFGNLQKNPQAGLVFMDFQENRCLQLSGIAQVFWHEDEPKTVGISDRYWEFSVREWREFPFPLQLQWEWIEASPYLPTLDQTGY